jgi:hypothetical protein
MDAIKAWQTLRFDFGVLFSFSSILEESPLCVVELLSSSSGFSDPDGCFVLGLLSSSRVHLLLLLLLLV